MTDLEKTQAIFEALDSFQETVPPAFQTVSSVRVEQRPAFGRMVAAFADWEFAPSSPRTRPYGVILEGAPGQGKTALACYLLRFAATRGRRPVYLNARDLEINLRGLPTERRFDTGDYRDLVEKAHVLVIDDVGLEASNQEARSLVRYLIDESIRLERFLILPTNLAYLSGDVGLLAHLADERLASRLQQLRPIRLAAEVPDYRKASPRG